jgi:wyosine [tRNA(Phe)-imidazoG37] synthetase (radical SAM superfamily)
MVLATPFPLLSGPARSERLGMAVSVDLSPADAPLVVSREYPMPRASVVVTTAAQGLIKIAKSGEKIESIVVHGSELDPTLHPGFREISENLRDLRNKWFPKAKLCLLASSIHLNRPEVLHTLSIYDRPILSLEWGTSKVFAAMTGEKSTALTALMANLTRISHLIVQARFVRGTADNSTDAEVKSWIKRLTEVRPREVQILTMPPKSAMRRGKTGKPVPRTRLQQIAAQVTEKTGIPTEVYADEPVAAPALES